MLVQGIIYKIKTAGEGAILTHLTECAGNFIPPLTETVDLTGYAKKIAEKSVTFEAWNDGLLVGLIAAYFNDLNQTAFITNVSVDNKFMGAGIASTLLMNCINYSKQKNINTIKLEVNKKNSSAIKLYEKFDFLEEYGQDNSLFMQRHLTETIIKIN